MNRHIKYDLPTHCAECGKPTIDGAKFCSRECVEHRQREVLGAILEMPKIHHWHEWALKNWDKGA